MGYVAVEAGEELIARAEELFEKQRVEGDSETLRVDQLDDQLSRVSAQAMSEGGLYAPRLAALAVKQAQGDTVEASFLLRAYRSTLERWDETVVADPAEMFATRRVSPAYKDVPGGQILGPTKDYTQRLLDFDLAAEDDRDGDPADPTAGWDVERETPETLTNVVDVLREQDLLADPEPPADADDPADITRDPITHPASRDAVLQALARGETGAVTALGYSALRGYGQVHPTLAEVRVGRLPVRIEHPYTSEPATVTSVEVSESEAVVPVYAKRDDPQFAFGYGLTLGRNERKAIGMTILDASIQLEGETEPAENPEFVLDVVDGLDSFGFIEHLKLPHYVTFQSILDRIRSIRERKAGGADGSAPDDAGDASRDATSDEPAGDAGDASRDGTGDEPTDDHATAEATTDD